MVVKKPIIIERQYDLIPGMREVNAELEKHEVVLQIEVEPNHDGTAHLWRNCYLIPLVDTVPILFRNRDPIAASPKVTEALVRRALDAFTNAHLAGGGIEGLEKRMRAALEAALRK